MFLWDNNEYGVTNRLPALILWSVLGFIIISVISFLPTAVYRVTYHPLAKYPGPFLAKITDLHAVYHGWKGDRHIENYRCHQRYGAVFRYGPNSLSFNTQSALQTIYGHKANCKKGSFYTVFPMIPGFYSVHSEVDQKSHAHKRKVLSHAFSEKALRDMEEYILRHVRAFCDILRSSSGPQNMADRCDYLTFDVLGDLCFGKSFEMQEKIDNRFAKELIAKSGRRSVTYAHMPHLRGWIFDKVFFRGITAARERYYVYAKTQGIARTQATTDRKDFFYYLLNAKDPDTGAGFSMSELWAEAGLLIVAGSDTSSTTLAATFFYLAHHPEILQKVTKEVRDTFSKENIEAIRSGPLLSSCTYLRACIDEAMRLSPPIPGILPREVLAGGMVIDGHQIPADTVVGVSAYSIHHNSKYYPEPFEYEPGRWLSKETAEVAQSAYCPFSIGIRSCIGKSMAYMELMSAMAMTLLYFDFRLAGRLGEGAPGLGLGRERTGEYQLQDIFVCSKDGPLVEFSKRR